MRPPALSSRRPGQRREEGVDDVLHAPQAGQGALLPLPLPHPLLTAQGCGQPLQYQQVFVQLGPPRGWGL